MQDQSPPQIMEYLVRFWQIANCIDRRAMSKREAAAALGKSTTWVSDCVAKLEAHWNCSLLTSKHGSKGATNLTAEGQNLFRRIDELLSRDSLLRPVNVHFSHSVLTSHFLSPAICSFIRDASADVRQRLVSRTEMDFTVVIRDIRSGDLDLAITWGLPDRTHNVAPGVEFELVGPEIEMVVVANSEDILNSVFASHLPSAEWLRRTRIVILSKERQPFPKEQQFDWMRQVSCLEVDTFDAALAFVRSSVGDFAIVPANYDELDRLRACGQICYRSLPSTKIQLAFFYAVGGRNRIPPDARRLLRVIEDHLVNISGSASIARGSKECLDMRQRFPTGDAWFEAMAYAYYLDIDRPNGGGVGWRWETVKLTRGEPNNSSDQANRSFIGSIENSYGDEFAIEHAQIVGELFVVEGRGRRKPKNSVNSFVSVFSWCNRDLGVMFGLWSGFDVKKQPAIYGTIWSHSMLTHVEVMQYANHASVSLVLNSTKCDRFDLQPQPETSFSRRKGKN